jgi:hypothetical protein
MDQFKQLYKEIDSILEQVKDQKSKTDIENLKKYIDGQENYYNNIPISIRTSNVLNVIIQRITAKITRIKKYINGDDNCEIIREAYSNQRALKEEAESNTITYAYLVKNLSNKEEPKDTIYVNALVKLQEFTELYKKNTDKKVTGEDIQIEIKNLKKNIKEENINNLKPFNEESEKLLNQINMDKFPKKGAFESSICSIM